MSKPVVEKRKEQAMSVKIRNTMTHIAIILAVFTMTMLAGAIPA